MFYLFAIGFVGFGLCGVLALAQYRYERRIIPLTRYQLIQSDGFHRWN